MLDDLEGRHMKTFISVLEEKSFSRAAERLGYVQSTVTAQIRQLEETCGRKLFNRLPRGVEPTDAGLRFSAYAYRFVRLSESLTESLEQLDEPHGTVRLCALESFCVARLANFIPAFLQQFPRVQLHLTTGFLADVVEQTIQQRIQIGIVASPPKEDTLEFTPLLDERLVMVTNSPLYARFEKSGWEGIRDAQMIGYGPDCLYHTYGQEILEKAGFRPSSWMDLPSVELIKQTVGHGMGIALLPEINVVSELKAGILHAIPIEQELKLTHGLITSKQRELGAATKALKQFFNHFSFTEKLQGEQS
jgi:LysR family transcriptional regulator, cell division regulator